MNWILKQVRRKLNDSVLHPVSWLAWAAVPAAALAIMHGLGWRVDTAVICGTVDPARGEWAMMRGMTYAVAYFATVVGSPILVLAGGLYVGMVAVARRRGRGFTTEAQRRGGRTVVDGQEVPTVKGGVE